MNQHFDIVIVGAGLVGSAMALALRDHGLKVALVEAQALSARKSQLTNFDDRSLVLNAASLRILRALDVLGDLELHTAAVRRIVISRRGEFGSVVLNSDEIGPEAFGEVLPARALGEQLHHALRASASTQLIDHARVVGIEPADNALSLTVERAGEQISINTRLLIAADGSDSPVREWVGINYSETTYEQSAIVATLKPERAHANCAFERFTDEGPLALLPRDNALMGLVYCVRPERVEELLALSERAFLAHVGEQAGFPLGRFSRLGPRLSYPLRLLRADASTADRTVLIGNAANTLHPIGGQGFNLGLRDVAGLLDLLLDPRHALGSAEQLDAYREARKADQDATVQFTDTLARASAQRGPLAAIARGAMMAGFNLPGPHRATLMRHAMGFRGTAPSLIRAGA